MLESRQNSIIFVDCDLTSISRPGVDRALVDVIESYNQARCKAWIDPLPRSLLYILSVHWQYSTKLLPILCVTYNWGKKLRDDGLTGTDLNFSEPPHEV